MFWGNDKDKDDKSNGNVFKSSNYSISHDLDDTYNTIKRSSQIYGDKSNNKDK